MVVPAESNVALAGHRPIGPGKRDTLVTHQPESSGSPWWLTARVWAQPEFLFVQVVGAIEGLWRSAATSGRKAC